MDIDTDLIGTLTQDEITQLKQGATLTKDFPDDREAIIESNEVEPIKEAGKLFDLDIVPSSIKISKAKFTVSKALLEGTDFTINVKNTGSMPLVRTNASGMSLVTEGFQMFSDKSQAIGLLRGEYPVKVSWQVSGINGIIGLLYYYYHGWVYSDIYITVAALGVGKKFHVKGSIPVKQVEYTW